MRRWMVLLALLGCKQTPVEPGVEDNFGVEPSEGIAGCENLVSDACLYPYPSGAFVDDAGLLVLPEEGAPVGSGSFSMGGFHRFKGFGAATPILFQLPGAVPPTDGIFELERSLGADAQVVVLNAATGERIPVWIEPDVYADALDPPLITIRPGIPLPRGTELVVGVRGLTDATGAVVAAPEGFTNLRDAEATRWRGVHERREHFENVIFPALKEAGFAREELQLAWSFPVRADDDATAPLVSVRDAIFAALPASGPQVTIDQITQCPGDGTDPAGCHPAIRTIIDGTVKVPSVMLPPDDLGVRLIRWSDAGEAVVDGVEEWSFRLQLPHSAFTADAPVPVLQYGHGFLGSYEEANGGWIRDFAERKSYAILATSMQGMNSNDSTIWLGVILREAGRFPQLSELAMQGVVNQLVQQRMMKTSLAASAEPALHRADGTLAWDPDQIFYHGNSQGGSVGTVVMGLSLDVVRGDLGVPGSGYPLLLHRSVDFTPFSDIITTAFPEPDAVSKFLAYLGTGWDDFDPLTFAPHIHGDPLAGTPDHEIILHVAKEDQQVHNQASFILGRAAGSVLMVPAVEPVFGLEEQAYPANPGVSLIEVDFGIPDDPTPEDAADGDPNQPNDGDTHGWLRKWEPAQDQMVHFFETGEIIDVCGGHACFHEGPP